MMMQYKECYTTTLRNKEYYTVANSSSKLERMTLKTLRISNITTLSNANASIEIMNNRPTSAPIQSVYTSVLSPFLPSVSTFYL